MAEAVLAGSVAELGKVIIDKAEIKCDANKAADQLGSAINSCTDDKTALILNNSGKLVTFWCYNDSDLLEWVCSSKPSAENGYIAMARRGGFFGRGIKVLDSTQSNIQHIIQAGNCYIYEGPGKMKLMGTIDHLKILQV